MLLLSSDLHKLFCLPQAVAAWSLVTWPCFSRLLLGVGVRSSSLQPPQSLKFLHHIMEGLYHLNKTASIFTVDHISSGQRSITPAKYCRLQQGLAGPFFGGVGWLWPHYHTSVKKNPNSVHSLDTVVHNLHATLAHDGHIVHSICYLLL